MTFTPYILWQEDDGFVIRALEYPITTQGDTKEDAIESLQEAIELYLEDPMIETYSPVSNVEIGNLAIYA